jgi:hypothetical protein
MTRQRECIACVVLVAALAPLTGCFSVVTRGYYEVRGAKGTIEFIERLAPGDLARYRSVRFEPATTTIGSKLCPSEVRTAYDRSARNLPLQLRERFPGGDPTLDIATEVLFFQKKGLFGDAQLLSRVKFKEQDRLVGDAIVVVGSKAFREGDANALAETAVKTLGKFLEKGVTPEEEEREKGHDQR